ncbi:MAG: MFS transporter [Clostridia bacterium]|nr:MFS transporter [Clostridia bacterium]
MNNGLKSKLAYGSGDIYGGAAFLIFSLLYMNFLVLVEGIDVVAASSIIFIGKIWDAVTDPFVGSLSDNTRSRYGRRRIYFLIGLAPVFLSFVMLFYSFGISGETAKIIYHMFAYMFFGTAFTIVMVPYNAILSDITANYNERTGFTTVRMIVSAGAALVAAVVPSIIIKTVGGETNGPAQKNGYLIMAVVFGLIFAACWLITFLGTKERKDFPPTEKFSFKKWISVLKNKSFRIYLGAFLSFQIAIDLILALFIFYIDIVILKYKSYELIIGTLLVCSLLFMALQGQLAKKKGKNFPLIIGMPIWILAAFVFIFITTETPVFVLLILAALIAIGSSAGNLSTWSMITDIFDVDELMTGQRREGVYSGFTTFVRKMASGIAILLLGVGLKAMGFNQVEYNILKNSMDNFDPAVYASSNIVQGIRLMFVIIPIVLLIVTFVFAIKYKVNNKRFDTIIKGIELLKSGEKLEGLTDEEKADLVICTGKPIDKLWGKE